MKKVKYKITKPIYIFKCWDSYFNPNIKCSEGFGGYENAKLVKCYTKIDKKLS